jgi:hypothetical protein
LVGFAELNGEYERLRMELDAAYSRSVWNSRTIDRIAERMARVEYALATAQHGRGGAPRVAVEALGVGGDSA